MNAPDEKPSDQKYEQTRNDHKGEDMNPAIIMDGIAKELEATIKAMAKAKTSDEKVAYSQVVKNLSESLGVFLEAVNNMMDYDFDEDDTD